MKALKSVRGKKCHSLAREENLLGHKNESRSLAHKRRKVLSDCSNNSMLQSFLHVRMDAPTKKALPIQSTLKPNKRTDSAESESISLTSEQMKVIQLAIGGRSIFFTGCAGTGKSVVLRHLKKVMDGNTYFVAPTGVAAVAVNGMTIHSFAGIRISDGTHEELLQSARRKNSYRRWTTAKTLVIDEISMLDGNLFESLERIARVLRGNSSPWGGIQIVASGDFAQLPPISKNMKRPPFCFETNAWKKTIKSCVMLKTVFRQKDDTEFIEILNAIRLGMCTPDMRRKLEARRVSSTTDYSNSTILYPHRSDVRKENIQRLNSLPGKPRSLMAVDTGSEHQVAQLDAACPAEKQLFLKEGVSVVLLANLDMGRKLVNGSRGTVVRFGSDGTPIVSFDCGVESAIRKHSWYLQTDSECVAKRTQYPLALSYALSIHKSQGMTLDSVVLSLASTFQPGMAYVGLSRVKSLQGLHLLDMNVASAVQVDPAVVHFYSTISSLI